MNFFKKLCYLIIAISTLTNAAGLDDFIITVKTNNVGTSANNEFTIPINNGGGGVTFHYNVDCDNDGNFEVDDYSGDYTCVYGSAGTYTIRIEDKIGDGTGFVGFGFQNGGDRLKLLSVEQWGSMKWKFITGAFWGSSNVVFNTTDVPNFSAVTDLSNMFRFAVNANPNTTNWDVSNVTSMADMFRSATSANPNTSNWDTSQVETMSRMFWNASSANPDVSGWDVTQVTSMNLMFANVTLPTADYDKLLISFNAQPVQAGISFHGGNSKYCASGAHNGLEINHGWNAIIDGGQEIASNCPNPADDFVITIKTDNLSTGSTGSTSMKIPTIGSGYDYSVDWNGDGTFDQVSITGDVTHDYGVAGTYSIRIRGDFPRIYFNYSGDVLKIMNITNWGANPWTSMENAFAGAENMTVTANFAPNLSNLTSLRRMFSGAILANPITTFWDVSNVTDMSFMFQEATSANPNVQNWDISNITSMDGMFEAVALPSADYDAMLLHFDSFSLSQILFDGGDSFYCSRLAQRARNHLDNTWNMSDGGLDPSCGALADDFVLKVDTTLAGTGGNPNTQFSVFTSSPNYNIDCNDDGINEASGHVGFYPCDFSSLGGAGIYTIRIMDN
ncbi:MAG TPA: BspA family leucine-rich repeat surface protein, partial [Oceanospirillales bacterium]|nr:BspA family leucine-rich repeat surface protein [Oceanospirillales bacterium]